MTSTSGWVQPDRERPSVTVRTSRFCCVIIVSVSTISSGEMYTSGPPGDGFESTGTAELCLDAMHVAEDVLALECDLHADFFGGPGQPALKFVEGDGLFAHRHEHGHREDPADDGLPDVFDVGLSFSQRGRDTGHDTNLILPENRDDGGSVHENPSWWGDPRSAHRDAVEVTGFSVPAAQ